MPGNTYKVPSICCAFYVHKFFRNRPITRKKRNSDVTGSDVNVLSSIEFKTFRSSRGSRKQASGEQGKVFSSPDNRYHVNLTYTHVIMSHLESGLKYKIDLKAVNRNTDSLVVTKQTFTGDVMITAQYIFRKMFLKLGCSAVVSEFNYRAGQFKRCVSNVSPPLPCFFGAVLSRR